MTEITPMLSLYIFLTGFVVLYAQSTHYIPLSPVNLQVYRTNASTSGFDQMNSQVPQRKPRQIRQDEATNQCQIDANKMECMPPFENIAHNAHIQATSTCGVKKLQRLCRTDGTCQICHADTDRGKFTVSRLTDRHQGHNQTCWASGFAKPGGLDQAVNVTLSLGKRFEAYYISFQPCSTGVLPDSIGLYKSSDFGRTWKAWHYFSTDCYRAFGLPTTNEHSAQISTANLQEVLCVALQPLNKQFRRRRSMYRQAMKGLNGSMAGLTDNGLLPDASIAFSTTLGRPSTQPWSPALIDWMTMTDLRIALMRFPPIDHNDPHEFDYRRKRTIPWNSRSDSYTKQLPSHVWSSSYPHSSYKSSPQRLPYDWGRRLRRPARSNRETRASFDDLTIPLLSERNSTNYLVNGSFYDNHRAHVVHMGPSAIGQTSSQRESLQSEPSVLSETEFYALGDLSIGGRCKCNGHASTCILSPQGQLTCACEHNTDGPDCERCKSGYMDRPWERATSKDANACTQCDCNLHSDECRFSNSLYLMSNRVSGGVCENCQHNTAGRNCQHCAEGYYRDWTKPISHEHVCLSCRCHPIGSIIRHDCDRRSGQCRCKQGVTGTTCDRCQDGYHQTRSPTNPCTKDYSTQATALAHLPVGLHCTSCSTTKERIRLKKFCRKDAVFQATFRSREIHGTMARFEMQVLQIWRLNVAALNRRGGPYWPSIGTLDPSSSDRTNELFSPTVTSDQSIPVWVRLNDLRCKCPEMELGITYLIVADFESYSNRERSELLFTPKTALLPWRSTWRRRLIRFKRKQNRGACDRYRDTAKLNRTSPPSRGNSRVQRHPLWYNDPVKRDRSFASVYGFQPVMRRAYRGKYPPYHRSWSYTPQ